VSFRAFRIEKDPSGAIAGRVVEQRLDDLSAGAVVLKVVWSGVNFKDARVATGSPRFIHGLPVNGGIDLGGIVETSEDPRFTPGSAVMATGYELGVSHDGGFAEYARLPGDWLTPLPAALTLQEAMTIGTAGFTAALAIVEMERNGLAPGNGPVAVTGATGGVGSLAIDCLTRLGYAVTAVTGKADQADYLRRLGATRVIGRDALAGTAKADGAAGWAGAIDPVGGPMLASLIETAAYRGVIANCGLTGGAELHTTVLPFIVRGVKLLGIDSVYCPSDLRQEVWRRLAGDMKPQQLAAVRHEITLDGISGAVTQLLAGTMRGRAVVRL
jgi:putative YhdH/YhfP family quinone oxidoreductase